MGSIESICIFLNSGRTFTFRNIVILCDNESMLSFSYVAMSDGGSKRAMFPKRGIAGWTVMESD